MKTVIPIAVKTPVYWDAMFSPSSQRWVATCDPMNLAMEADSLDELRGAIEDTVQEVLRDLYDGGVLRPYLDKRGWWAEIPAGYTGEGLVFGLPWKLIAEGALD